MKNQKISKEISYVIGYALSDTGVINSNFISVSVADILITNGNKKRNSELKISSGLKGLSSNI